MNTDRLANLAIQMNLTIAQAVALTCAIGIGANKTGLSRGRFIEEMERNQELRDYVKNACILGGAELAA